MEKKQSIEKLLFKVVAIIFVILVACGILKADTSFIFKRSAIKNAKPVVLYRHQSRPIYKSPNGVTFVVYKGANGKWIKRFITV